jgi:hypothetical protein
MSKHSTGLDMLIDVVAVLAIPFLIFIALLF